MRSSITRGKLAAEGNAPHSSCKGSVPYTTVIMKNQLHQAFMRPAFPFPAHCPRKLDCSLPSQQADSWGHPTLLGARMVLTAEFQAGSLGFKDCTAS